MLNDTFGRVATDLRVSLTDRCSPHCTYCMSEEGLLWLARVRFTGGEPLPRPGLVGIVERCAALVRRPKLSLITNGIGLRRTAQALKYAGLDRRLAGHPAPHCLQAPDPA
jgi:cyclic pyranopterin phosphate synthase